MRTHISILAWIHIALGTLTALAGIAMGLLFLTFGHEMQHGWREINQGDMSLPFRTNPMSMMGWLALILAIVMGIPGIIAGIGLLRYSSWGRAMGIAVSILNIVFLTPLHIALGVYGLVILFNQETGSLFARTSSV